ncbi:MAG: DUF2235 domain-containing protein [Geminicoccaceae bacterium]
MTKKLVVCCDGTWNKPRDNTNVRRTYEALRRQLQRPTTVPAGSSGGECCTGASADGDLVLFYDEGVGTRSAERFTGGAFGAGLSQNVCDAYHFLSQHYAPGDSIYIFGFSRGAYTARSLCGFLQSTRGLIAGATLAQVERAYLRYYASRERIVSLGLSSIQNDALTAIAGWFSSSVSSDLDGFPRHPARVRFIGVYDTVGALGIPLPRAERINAPIVGFHNTSLCDVVDHAVQALAIDERRGPYRPAIWRLPDGMAALPPGRSCLQVWFPGVHSDIGGGYPDKGIGDLTLGFMLDQALAQGLAVDRSLVSPGMSPTELPRQHESFDAQWQRLAARFEESGTYSRPVGPAAREALSPGSGPVAGTEMLHVSAVERLGRDVSIVTEDDGGERLVSGRYAPASLTPLPDLPVLG